MLGTNHGAYHIETADDEGIKKVKGIFQRAIEMQQARMESYHATVAKGESAYPPFLLIVLADLGAIMDIISGQKVNCAW